MIQKSYFLYKSVIFSVFLLLSMVGYAQNSFLIDFPAFSTSPTGNPRNLTVCNGSSMLQVKLSAAMASTNGATVKIDLPDGVNYVPGTVAVVSSNAGLTLVETNITNLNIPEFSIPQANIAIGNEIVFTIQRTADCVARTRVIAGAIFQDTVSAQIGTTISTRVSGSYTVNYPVLNFSQPATQTNAVTNQNYSRTFSVANGGNGAASTIYVQITYPSNGGITPINLRLTGGNGSAGTPVTLTPVINGNVYTYTVSSANLSGGSLGNGETLIFTEDYRVILCNSVTNYTIGWGCSPAPTDWCDPVSGSGEVSMASGVPNLGSVTIQPNNYVDACTPFTAGFVYTNSGSGNAQAAAMYNIKLRLGGGSASTLGNFDWRYYNITGATINGQNVPVVNGNVFGIASFDLNNLFTSDVDGAGGLADLDGDGFFDDLPGGNQSITIVLTFKVNCSYYTSCNANDGGVMNYGIYADAQYNTMCQPTTVSTSTRISNLGTNNFGPQYVRDLTSTSYAPANVFGGQTFNARFSMGWYIVNYPLNSPNARYVYEITLPAGVSVAGTGNVVWRQGKYPGTATTGTPTVSQSGNILTVTSPNNQPGYFTINLVYTCGVGGEIDIPFKFKRLDNIATGCTTCNADLFCGALTLGNVVCPDTCSTGGASITFSKVERADNSLGWTDTSLTTLQSRTNITSYDLSKALYLDDIEIQANGRQSATQNNLYLKTSIAKLGGISNKLQPEFITVVIKNPGGNIVSSGTLNSTFATITSSGTDPNQTIVWNLSSLLQGGNIPNGYTYETKATYSVITNQLPLHDEQTGVEMYFYNLSDSGSELRCNFVIPEMYLVGTNWWDAHNGGASLTATSCDSFNVGAGTNYISRRFDSSGVTFQSENRPGFKAISYEFTVPDGFVLERVTMNRSYPNGGTTDVTSALTQNGSTYTFNFTGEYGYNISVLNTYNLVMTVFLRPTCSVQATGAVLNTKFTYIDYYYHYKLNGPLPTPLVANKNLNLAYNMSTRPSISIANQAGTIQATKPVETTRVRISSTGTTNAPYVWMAIPDQTGIEIVEVRELPSGNVISLLDYDGGVWVKLTATGIPSAGFRDFEIDFRYTTCTASNIHVEAGWNCFSYPNSPDEYLCNVSEVNLPFNPIPGAVQVSAVTQPDMPLSGLCEPLDYQYSLTSAGGGNIKDVKMEIRLNQGMVVDPGTIQVEYPSGSGNWASVSTTVSGSIITLDLTTHPNYDPNDGLAGTANDGGNINNRIMNVRFDMTPDCTIVPGSNFSVVPLANNSCGSATTGNGAALASNSITVENLEPDYLISSEFDTSVELNFENCSSPVTLPLRQTIVASNPIGDTGTVRINLPIGYDFGDTPTVNCDPSSVACPTIVEVAQDPTDLYYYMILSIPSGLVSGDQLIYGVNIEPTDENVCGLQNINVTTYDEVGGVTCPSQTSGFCPNFVVETGTFDFEFTVTKPDYLINAISGSIEAGVYTGTISVENTSDLDATSPVTISFYCMNLDGTPSTTLLGTATLSTPIAANEVLTETYTFSGASCPTSEVYAVIEEASNCLCTEEDGMTFSVTCQKPGASGAALASSIGILTKGDPTVSNWPMSVPNGYIVLDSEQKGMVITHMTTGQINALTPVDGMMVYDTDLGCVKLYRGTAPGTDATRTGWNCIEEGCNE